MNLSNSAINKIGDRIRCGEKSPWYKDAVKNLNTWREAHGSLMDEYYDKCIKLCSEDSFKNILVAQRLKRLPTIIGKLNRFKTMRLSSMQDIAGVRLVVRDMEQLSIIEKRIKRWKNLYKVRDYIRSPKSDGYRGKHFIFKQGGMFVEIQLRTQIQHIWATSVETVDVFNSSSIKFGENKSYWYKFFQQTSSAFAGIEGTNLIRAYKGKTIDEICQTIAETIKTYGIDQKLKTIEVAKRVSLDQRINKNVYYIVLELNSRKNNCYITGFRESDYDIAVREYQKLERRQKKNSSIVLVSVNDIRKLDNAYPNYFLNLKFFNELLKFMLDESKKKGYNSNNEHERN